MNGSENQLIKPFDKFKKSIDLLFWFARFCLYSFIEVCTETTGFDNIYGFHKTGGE
jgi:hypothetical protein